MNMMKKFFAILLILGLGAVSALSLSGQEKKPVFRSQTSIPGGKNIFRCGDTIPFKVAAVYPENFSLCAWSLYAYTRGLPENFASVMKKKIGNPKSEKWASVTLVRVKWLPFKQRKTRTLDLTASTKGFPEGDYQLTVSLVFQGKGKDGKTQTVYRSSNFAFSLEK